MAERFYVNSPLAPGPVLLEGAEAHHLATVCRFRPGDAVCLFNGDGAEYLATIQSVSKRQVSLDIATVVAANRELPFPLEVAAPLPKGDRASFLIEKLTETGVTRFVPLRTHRSVVHPHDRKLEKLERVVIEACKQCGRNVLMEVRSLTDWSAYCQSPELPKLRYLGHPAGPVQTAENRFDAAHTVAHGVAWAVGPEGGFTDDEVTMAREADWRVIDLGPRILRVETAALVLPLWLLHI